MPPFGPDGKRINLHHALQGNDDALFEIGGTFHQQNNSTIHINPNSIPSGINRTEFNNFRKRYWQRRASEFNS